MGVTNHRLNHVAVSVPSIEVAVDWYHDVFGFTRLRDDVLFSRARDPDAVIFSIYPSNLNTVKVAYLETGCDVGLEIFEFIDPPYTGPGQLTAPHFNTESCTRGGFFHIAVTVDDVDALGAKAVSRGARQIGKTQQLAMARTMYLMDPWGNVFELLNKGFREVARHNV